MKNLLERVGVAFRCPMNWSEMEGDEQKRFCQQCEKTVTDLSALTEEEVRAFVAQEGSRGRACVRILRDEKGRLVTRGCGSNAAASAHVARRAAAVGAAAGGLALASCSSPPEPIPLLGVMCVQPEK